MKIDKIISNELQKSSAWTTVLTILFIVFILFLPAFQVGHMVTHGSQNIFYASLIHTMVNSSSLIFGFELMR